MNVSDVGETVPSVRSLDDSARETFAVGCDVSRTVKAAWPPTSVVGPVGGEIVNPAVSSSTLVIETFAGF
ncbi:MAG: hypothetical protein ABL963_09565, partial [Longimicrobiales bacterium]